MIDLYMKVVHGVYGKDGHENSCHVTDVISI